MNTLDMVISHITQGNGYSWDLTTLIGLGIPVSVQLRERLLNGSANQEDADHIRTLATQTSESPAWA